MEERIADLLSQMTLDEKIAMVSGTESMKATGCERLEVPRLTFCDGPNGAAGGRESGKTAACFPVGTALAATWNTKLIHEIGAALADECRSKDVQVLLAPTVNIHRTPLAGRNFECYSEDPFLTAEIAIAYINGLQENGIGACIKHFVCNDSEFERHWISSVVDERSLREIYLYPFERAIAEAKPWLVMSAYNKINGVYASSHRELLTDILKDEWGFEGFVVSDWGASLETVENANGGLDLEMPGPGQTMGARLLKAIESGDVAEATVEDKVRRILRVTMQSERWDRPAEQPEQETDLPEHRALLRTTAAEGMVLLTNNGVLPLAKERLQRVAVIGPNAASGTVHGGGSSAISAHYVSQPLDALRERLGSSTVVYEQACSINRYIPPFEVATLSGGDGFRTECYNNVAFAGAPIEEGQTTKSHMRWQRIFANVESGEAFSARLTSVFTPAESGVHTFGLFSCGRSRMFVDGNEIIDIWTKPERGETFYGWGSTEVRAEVELEAGHDYELVIEYCNSGRAPIPGMQFGVQLPVPVDMWESALSAAEAADAVVCIVGTTEEWESEGFDRVDMKLPGRQDELISALCAANPNTIVVLNTGSPVEMPWADEPAAILQAWFPGQEFGNALTDVLLGEVNPSGKLPTTFPKKLMDVPAMVTYPGKNGEVEYVEKLQVGYRGFDAQNITPLFPFGHGLSYTRFTYGEPSVEVRDSGEVRVAIPVENSGELAGEEVVQIYVAAPHATNVRPPRELKGFKKLALAPGEIRTAEVRLNRRAFAFYDATKPGWVTPAGIYELQIGSSSADIRASVTVDIT